MQTSMTGRPRPVTATVTKPKWMQIPNPDAMRKIRSRSVESNGSTASLTSFLDHDSYNNASDIGENFSEKTFDVTDSMSEAWIKEQQHKIISENAQESQRARKVRSKSSDGGLSAWELWIIQKAKNDQQRKQKERLKKEREKVAKEEQEREKHIRILKADTVRSSWLQKKNEEMLIQKRMEKMRIQEEKRRNEETEAQKKEKAAEKFDKWQKSKQEEEKEKRKKLKEEEKAKKLLEVQRKVLAGEKFQQWLKMAQNRPKTAPNSFGYLSGKVTGYHDRCAYPEPSFYNPVPWQPPSISSSQIVEKKKNKVKPYKWNPDKYL